MAKYQQYEEYKNSGIEWLGKIPSHWVVQPLKHQLIFMKNGSTSTQIDETKETAPISRIETISSGEIDMSRVGFIDIKTIPKTFELDKGDILFSHINSLSMIGNLAIKRNNDKLFHGMNLLRLKLDSSKCVVDYMFWLLKSKNLRQVIEANAKPAINQASISTQSLKNIYLNIPTEKEQTQIANFLDHETAQIDTLIDKQQTLIQLLKEKRQAVISHAVTKGLNPDAPMKDSGVEWLGEVPEHWEVIQAKYIADITRGAILRPVDAPEYFDENGEWSYLNISDATKCDKYLYESKLRLSPLGSKKSARVYPNNLIITASATIGKAFINKVKVCVHDGFIPFCNIKVDINYLYHYVSNPYLYAAMGKSNTQKNIYLDEVKNMIVTVPSREEQEKIVEHIEKNQNEYSKLIDKAQKAIQLMQERRTALISAAVTGKIDVRGWRASE